MANILNWRNQVKFTTGDTIKVHQTVKEGDKTRTQIFEGVVMQIRGHQGLKSFTVRKIAAGGIGVERIFPEEAPVVTKIEVAKKGKVRRANLSYLRGRIGKKATRVKDVFVKKESELSEAEKEEMAVVAKRAAKIALEGEAEKEAKAGEKEKKKAGKKKKVERKEKTFVR